MPRDFDPIGRPHTQGTEHDPGDQPEEIEGETENHWINAVPERDREAHRNDGNQAEPESADRWFFHLHRSAIITCRAESTSVSVLTLPAKVQTDPEQEFAGFL